MVCASVRVLPCLLGVLALAPFACGDDALSPGGEGETELAPANGGISCTPGAELGCQCFGGQAGTQLCLPSGHELGACRCNDGVLDGGSTGPATDDSSGEPPMAMCGNGMVEEGEQCDDGNSDYEDACNNECIASCGPMWTSTVEGSVPRDLDPHAGDAVIDARGRLLVTGTIDESGDGGDLWIARRGPEGRDLWSQTVEGGDGPDGGQAIAADTRGNVLVVGHWWSNESRDVWARMLGVDGAAQWTMVHDDLASLDDAGTGAAFDPQGNAIVVGTVTTAPGETDAWVRKLDPTGQELWTTTWPSPAAGPPTPDQGGAVVTNADGDVFVLARAAAGRDTFDAVMLQYDADGNGPLSLTIPLADAPRRHDHRPLDLAIGPDGSLTMLIEALDARGVPSFSVHRIADDLTPMWSFEGSALEVREPLRATGLGVDEQGGVGLLATVLQRPSQGFAIRLDTDGAPLCSRPLAGEAGTLSLGGGTVDPGGNMYAIGVSAGQPWLGRFRR